MFSISKSYGIRDDMDGKPVEDGLETKLIYLPKTVLSELKLDAQRCKRSLVKHIEAILTAYLGHDVNLSDMSGVRAAVQPHITARTDRKQGGRVGKAAGK